MYLTGNTFHVQGREGGGGEREERGDKERTPTNLHLGIFCSGGLTLVESEIDSKLMTEEKETEKQQNKREEEEREVIQEYSPKQISTKQPHLAVKVSVHIRYM